MAKEPELLHSVAFRVTEAQWLTLQKRAQQLETTVPQLAKLALFRKARVAGSASFT